MGEFLLKLFILAVGSNSFAYGMSWLDVMMVQKDGVYFSINSFMIEKAIIASPYLERTTNSDFLLAGSKLFIAGSDLIQSEDFDL
jgi:hypothetical protein